MRWKRADVGVGLLRGILERLENIPMCMEALRHTNRQRVKKSQLKLSFCLLVTLIRLWSMALALDPKSPEGWSWGRAGSGRALECICLRNNCD